MLDLFTPERSPTGSPVQTPPVSPLPYRSRTRIPPLRSPGTNYFQSTPSTPPPFQLPRSTLNLNVSNTGVQISETDLSAAYNIARTTANAENQLLQQSQAIGLAPPQQQIFQGLLALHSSTLSSTPFATASRAPTNVIPYYEQRANTTTTLMTTSTSHFERSHTERMEQDSDSEAILMMQS